MIMSSSHNSVRTIYEDSHGRIWVGTLSGLNLLDPESGTVRERKVVIGEIRDNDIEIYEGLKAGELVVTAGVAFLHDGMAAEQWDPETNPVR